jgi:predicted enzyme related to lactoylglutathione lyase
MRILHQRVRLDLLSEELDDQIAFLEELQNVKLERRGAVAGFDVTAAVVGGFMIHAGPEEHLNRDVDVIFYVDVLEDFIPVLEKYGAERVSDIRDFAGGRNMYYRHPGGLHVEYYQAVPS